MPPLKTKKPIVLAARMKNRLNKHPASFSTLVIVLIISIENPIAESAANEGEMKKLPEGSF
ncbi:hypothetical protein [Glaciimonas soli]|uniref:Uncharacterized protein n=1 Tax=Glaciimonas soli TaxID=2590999 RepID=A0A843YXT2_9BURK|nr:hypothetical protein [Glaciimonas soli]MQR02474.1 hypothetical protein [Glaciimonas soli]